MKEKPLNHFTYRFWSRLMLLGTLLSSSLTGFAQTPAMAPFTRVTNGVIATEKFTSTAAAWGDIDNDGWLDLFVGNNDSGGRNSLFKNNQDETFAKIMSDPVATNSTLQPHAAAFGDYDNDGWIDLALANLQGVQNYFYHNSGGGSFALMTPETVGEPASDAGISVGVSFADYDRDGFLDLFIANGALVRGEASFLYHNEANGSFTRVADHPATVPTLRSTQGSWADFDADGDLDLFVTRSQDDGNALYRNDGGGNFTDVTANANLADFGDSVGAAWGDCDNDGDLDLFVTNLRLSGPNTKNFFYLNQGDGTFLPVKEGALVSDAGHFLSCAWVDFDNDGWLDLFVTVNPPTGASATSVKNRLYHNQGDGSFVRVTQGRLVTDFANAAGCAWGDYNNDGFPDVFVANGSIFAQQSNGLYRNNTNGNSWIKVKCVGTASNRSAIGVKVSAKAVIAGRERWQMRQIIGSEGWLSFNALEAIIGLGDANMVDLLRIEWPSGLVQEFRNLPVRQSLTITEGQGSGSRAIKVTNTNDTGPGSFRQAILDGNATMETDLIVFDLPEQETFVIKPRTALPKITAPLTIDGTTQKGYRGSPIIELDGSGGVEPLGVGLWITAGGTTVRGLVINQFGGLPGEASAHILLDGASSNAVENCYIGLEASGDLVLIAPHADSGLEIRNSSSNRIGGNSAALRNAIAGHLNANIRISGRGSKGNVVAGNFIGISATGLELAPRAAIGVVIDQASDNLIGGSDLAANIIGSYTVALSIIGGARNAIVGNRIGADVTGTNWLASGGGILISHSMSNMISRNAISGCGNLGFDFPYGAIHLRDASKTRVTGNFLGIEPVLSIKVGNSGPGIVVEGDSADNLLGGLLPGEGNVVTHSAAGGIEVVSLGSLHPRRTTIRGNSIYDNVDLGINLIGEKSNTVPRPDGNTPNDAGDSDGGPNGFQNFPVITSAENIDGRLMIRGELNSSPSARFDLDFYFSPACDGRSAREGEQYIGSSTVVTDGQGNASFEITFPFNTNAGQAITSTATDESGNTSESSPCSLVTTELNRATGSIPFRAWFNVTNLVFPNPTDATRLEVRVGGAGEVTDLGWSTCVTENQHGNLLTGRAVADYAIQDANGDHLVLQLEASIFPDTTNASRITFDGEGTIVRGTGRLAGAKGQVRARGWSETKNPLTGEGIGYLEWQGEISKFVASLTVLNTNSSGPGSLSQAMLDSEATPKIETIAFSLPGVPPYTIQPEPRLPVMLKPVQIDATTQPGFQGKPIVEISGAARTNHFTGITLSGGRSFVRGLVINRFLYQILISEKGSNVVQKCWLGTDLAGRSSFAFDLLTYRGSGTGIVIVLSRDNQIGGVTAGESNVISGNGEAGIDIVGGTNNVIKGNFIGTDFLGGKPLPNGFEGVRISSALSGPGSKSVGNLIGGDGLGAGNVISGNRYSGIYLSDGRANLIIGNLIGLDQGGTQTVPNGTGIRLSSTCLSGDAVSSNVISGNIIGGNLQHGISIDLCNARQNVIRHNWIGTDRTGQLDLGNLRHGILIGDAATGNVIGGTAPGEANIIAYNRRSGVFIGSGASGGFEPALPSQRSSIRGNSIYRNGQLGIDIDLDPNSFLGVLANDPGDGDSGPNGRQNYPVLSVAEYADGELRVEGVLNSRPGATFDLDFFASSECDTVGHGEGERYLGSAAVATDSAGNAPFSFLFRGPLAFGQVVASTATDRLGNTSEFSACTVVLAGRPKLTLVRNIDNTWALSWGPSAAGFVLEKSDSLTPPAWQPAAGGPGTGDRHNLEVEGTSFFRLRKP